MSKPERPRTDPNRPFAFVVPLRPLSPLAPPLHKTDRVPKSTPLPNPPSDSRSDDVNPSRPATLPYPISLDRLFLCTVPLAISISMLTLTYCLFFSLAPSPLTLQSLPLLAIHRYATNGDLQRTRIRRPRPHRAANAARI
jgi:hypothetical protein